MNMKKSNILIILLATFTLSINTPAIAQDTILPANTSTNGLINVFLDFHSQNQYIREKINFVNYVRDRQMADVQIMLNRHSSGTAGRNYVFTFIGREKFTGMNNEITFWAPSTNTDNETRKGMVDAITFGLMPYVANTSLAGKITINISDIDTVEREEVADPWKNWTFEIYGGLNLHQESKQSRFDSRWGIFADKLSEDWKIRARPYFNINSQTFVTEDIEISRNRFRHGFDGFLIRSINQHWSVGFFVDMLSSTFHNILFNIEAEPGIEYSFLPYTEANYRAITLDYRIGAGHHRYIEETIFFKMQENLYHHSLNFTARLQQPWGSFEAGISGSHYFHDFTANRISLESDLELRIIKGLSLNLWGNFEFINDLVALPAGDLPIEDVLLQQSRQATDYEVSAHIGLTYTFGSDFVNVINTRF